MEVVLGSVYRDACFAWFYKQTERWWYGNKSNTTGATNGAGTAYLSEPPEFTPGF
jgi:hypothetical protein